MLAVSSPSLLYNMSEIKYSLLITEVDLGPCAHKQKKVWLTHLYILSKEHIHFQGYCSTKCLDLILFRIRVQQLTKRCQNTVLVP